MPSSLSMSRRCKYSKPKHLPNGKLHPPPVYHVLPLAAPLSQAAAVDAGFSQSFPPDAPPVSQPLPPDTAPPEASFMPPDVSFMSSLSLWPSTASPLPYSSATGCLQRLMVWPTRRWLDLDCLTWTLFAYSRRSWNISPWTNLSAQDNPKIVRLWTKAYRETIIRVRSVQLGWRRLVWFLFPVRPVNLLFSQLRHVTVSGLRGFSHSFAICPSSLWPLSARGSIFINGRKRTRNCDRRDYRHLGSLWQSDRLIALSGTTSRQAA